MGQQDVVMADYLSSLQRDLLVVSLDSEWRDILGEARSKGFHTSVPTDWAGARQMNHGLYEALAQFDIKPPCLRIGVVTKPKSFVQVVGDLSDIVSKLEKLNLRLRQEE
jgi:hypothetical protein